MKFLRDLWADAHPFGWGIGWQFYPAKPPWPYRIAHAAALRARRLVMRFEAAHALLTGDQMGADLTGWQYRLKTLLLIWLPVRWHYPDHPSDACEVIGWDSQTWNGGEMTCWEASFVAIQPGWRLGLAHIYREGGP